MARRSGIARRDAPARGPHGTLSNPEHSNMDGFHVFWRRRSADVCTRVFNASFRRSCSQSARAQSRRSTLSHKSTRRVSLTPFQSPPLAKPKETTLRMSAADLGGFSLPTGPNLGGFDPFEDDGKASKKTESKASGAVHIRVQQRVRLDLEIETLPYAWTPLLSHYLTCVSRSMARRMEKSP